MLACSVTSATSTTIPAAREMPATNMTERVRSSDRRYQLASRAKVTM